MTTLSYNDFSDVRYVAANRSPRKSFAARLAALQAAQEQSPHLNAVFGAAVRVAAAAVPVCVLAYLFVFV
jgi:hypothetical protein